MSNNNNNTDFSSAAGASTSFIANNRAPEAEYFEASHQALVSSGDEVDKGDFKGLYPKVERNKATGETYRPMSRDRMLGDNVIVKLDLIAVHVGKEKNGEQLGAFLLRDPINVAGQKPIEQVVMRSHGSINSRRDDDEIVLEKGMPVISFLAPHEKILETGLGHIVPYAKVSSEGITLTSHQAKNDFETLGCQAITGTLKLGAIHNYDLQKFDDEPLQFDSKHTLENVSVYMQIQRTIAANLSLDGKAYETDASKLKPEGRFIPLFDTIAIRGRGPELSVRDAIKIAQEHGYKNIICNFCRSPVSEPKPLWITTFFRKKEASKPAPEVYNAKDTKLLEKPIFYSWDEIKKLEHSRIEAIKHDAELSVASRMSH